jgi:CRP-like cAMP-binding protein/CheY-like chemotaxis protein
MQGALEVFRTFSCFRDFPKDVLENLANLSEIVHYQPGEIILQQGAQNHNLLFLKMGRVAIQVDGETIFNLGLAGEVLGEMSFISHKTTSAAVVALTQVEAYQIDARRIGESDQHIQERALFNKIIASVLAERLRLTNEKAKQHEMINKNLEELVAQRTIELEKSLAQLEVQNTTLLAGFRALEDQEKARQGTLVHIQRLQERTLPFLQATFKGLGTPDLDESRKALLAKVSQEVDFIGEELGWLKGIFEQQNAMEHKKVLLLESQKKLQLVTKMALGGTGVGLEIAVSTEEALRLLRDHQFDLILSDLSFSRFLKDVHQQKPEMPVIVMVSGRLEAHLPTIKDLDFVRFLVSRDAEDRSLTVKTVVTTINKVLTRDFLGLEKYLSWGVDVNEILVKKSSDRADCITEMVNNLKKIGIRTSLLERCATVAEEQLMNAIYDAPQDNHGQSLFNHLPRTAAVELQDHQAARLRYACDGNFIAVSVRDPFGSLSRKVLFDYLQACYNQGDATAVSLSEKASKGGAGKGLHQIVENSDLTVFNVQNRIFSEVICLFAVDAKEKTEDQSANLHYFFF